MDTVSYPGAAIRFDPALVGVEGLFPFGPGGEDVGDDDGDERKQDGYSDE